MRVDLFDFDLRTDRIALRPVEPRDAARMLVVLPAAVSGATFEDRIVRDLPDLLSPGDILVVNDTRVIPARLEGRRVRGEASARIEATLHKREGANHWRAFVRPVKKLKAGEIIAFEASGSTETLDAEVVEKGEEGEVLLSFALAGSALDVAIERVGRIPLPPYISGKRPGDDRDAGDYQTLFARRSGAVAAPTASLHFTPELIAALDARDIAIEKVTLHVGAGTFLPVKAADTKDHKMHAEWGEVSAQTAKTLSEARRAGRRIIAAGTTSLRILESAADLSGMIGAFSGETSIFITPGYKFRAVDALLTNFHLPRSTLFMLVCAFSGIEAMRAAYAHAIAENYRFYSYGDACLLFPAQQALA